MRSVNDILGCGPRPLSSGVYWISSLSPRTMAVGLSLALFHSRPPFGVELRSDVMDIRFVGCWFVFCCAFCGKSTKSWSCGYVSSSESSSTAELTPRKWKLVEVAVPLRARGTLS
ncbi:hypothetical protein NQZ79_g4716 [Umbelopsis isabellina]|nr:hypothetical protein NQZ79_g4716 [Umbelopsis isabellina]